MKKKTFDPNRTILAVFTVLALFLIIFIVTVTAGIDRASDSLLRSFAEGWEDPEGNIYNIEYVRVNDDGISSPVANRLPADISDSDSLCFESYNITCCPHGKSDCCGSLTFSFSGIKMDKPLLTLSP